MSLNISARSAENGKIFICEDYDVRYWTKELDINENQLRILLGAVGPSMLTVRARLGQLSTL